MEPFTAGEMTRHILIEEGKDIDLPVPSLIAPEVRFQSVSVGDSILCGIATSGHAYCWGDALADTKPVLISGDADLPINQFRPIVRVWSDHRWRCLLLGNKLFPHFRCTLTFRNHVPVRIKRAPVLTSVSSSTGC